MNRAWLICALLVGLPGCARGCSTPIPPAPQPIAPHANMAPPQAPAAKPSAAKIDATALPVRVETALSVHLPRRTKDAPFPGFATLPRRRLRRFDPKNHLLAQLDGDHVTVLGKRVSAKDTDALHAALREAIEVWAQRSGISATRLVLVVDRAAQPTMAANLRRVAMSAHTWRVVTLAREGDRLMEVHLSPPGQRKP